jgi:pSer/pThr/pTyr-binding forkhead associated (FHA) protein
MLKILFDDGKGFDLGNHKHVSIGNDKTNDIYINNNSVSRFHAEIVIENNKIFLVDLNSTNGTFVNNERLKVKSEINLWNNIKFGNVSAQLIDTEKRMPTASLKSIDNGITDDKWFIIGINKNYKGKTFPVDSDKAIGRDHSNDIILNSEMISRFHAKLIFENGNLKLKDLGSSNGTFVNNVIIKEKYLKSGDRIKFADLEFNVRDSQANKDNLNNTSNSIKNLKTEINRTINKTSLNLGVINKKLVIQNGQNKGQIYNINKKVITIGRFTENDIVLNHDTVSGFHAEIRIDNKGSEIIDKNSKNGIYLNGKKIKKSASLKNGDTIQCGKMLVKYISDGSFSGTQNISSLKDNKTKRIYFFLLPVFLVFIAYMAYYFINKSGPKVITEKLQAAFIWTKSLGNGRNNPLTPLLEDINNDTFLDVIVTDSSGFVAVFDGQEGKKIFDREIPDRIVVPAISSDVTGNKIKDIIVASYSGNILALDGKGKLLWQSQKTAHIGNVVNMPVLLKLNQDKIKDIVVPTSKKGLVAFDGSRGWEIWNTKKIFQNKIITSPVVADVNNDGIKDIISMTETGYVAAISSTEKKLWVLWERQISQTGYASPLFVKNKEKSALLIFSKQKIIAINAKNGNELWKIKTNKNFYASPIKFDRRYVIALSEDGTVFKIEFDTGKIIWRKNLYLNLKASPALFDVNNDNIKDIILVPAISNSKVIILDGVNGDKIFEILIENSNKILASPVLGDVNNNGLVDIVVADKNGIIYAIELNRSVRKSEKVWSSFLNRDN